MIVSMSFTVEVIRVTVLVNWTVSVTMTGLHFGVSEAHVRVRTTVVWVGKSVSAGGSVTVNDADLTALVADDVVDPVLAVIVAASTGVVLDPGSVSVTAKSYQ